MEEQREMSIDELEPILIPPAVASLDLLKMEENEAAIDSVGKNLRREIGMLCRARTFTIETDKVTEENRMLNTGYCDSGLTYVSPRVQLRECQPKL